MKKYTITIHLPNFILKGLFQLSLLLPTGCHILPPGVHLTYQSLLVPVESAQLTRKVTLKANLA